MLTVKELNKLEKEVFQTFETTIVEYANEKRKQFISNESYIHRCELFINFSLDSLAQPVLDEDDVDDIIRLTKKISKMYLEILPSHYIKFGEEVNEALATAIDHILEKYLDEIYVAGGCHNIHKRYRTLRFKMNKSASRISKLVQQQVQDEINELTKSCSDLYDYITEYYKSTLTDEVNDKKIIDNPASNDYDVYKITEVREIQELLEENGYVFTRQTGSHRVYEQIESKKIVVVPIHHKHIHKGLSYTIQKQIYANK